MKKKQKYSKIIFYLLCFEKLKNNIDEHSGKFVFFIEPVIMRCHGFSSIDIVFP